MKLTVSEGILLDDLDTGEVLPGNTDGNKVDGNVLRNVNCVRPLSDGNLQRGMTYQ